jgi:hypothetical protein
VTRSDPRPTAVLVAVDGAPLRQAVVQGLQSAGFPDVLAFAPNGSLLPELGSTRLTAAVLAGRLCTDEALATLPEDVPLVVVGRPAERADDRLDRAVRVSDHDAGTAAAAVVQACRYLHQTPAKGPAQEAEATDSGRSPWLGRVAALLLSLTTALLAVAVSPTQSSVSVDLGASVTAPSYVAPPQEADARVAVVRVAQQVIDAGSSLPPRGVTLEVEEAGDRIRLRALTRDDADLDAALADLTRLVRAESGRLVVPSLPPGAVIRVPEVSDVDRSRVRLRGDPLPTALRTTLLFLALLALARRAAPRWAAHPVRVVVAGSAALAVAATAVAAPAVAAGLAAGALALAALRGGTWQLALLAVLTTALVRPLSDAGVVPGWLNFLDLPLVALAGLRAAAALPRRRPSRLAAVAVLLAVVAVSLSWSLSAVSPLRAIATTAVLVQPWLLLAALRLDPPPSMRGRQALLAAVVLIGALQFPVAVVQALVVGVGDGVNGTYAGSVNGAHTTASVSLLLVLVTSALALRGLLRRELARTAAWGAATATAASVLVLADAKQVVLVLPVAVVALLIGLPRRTTVRAAAGVVVAATLLVGLFAVVNPQWRTGVTVFTDAVGGSSGKAVGAEIVVDAMEAEPRSWVVGLGPGTTVTRVALLSGDTLSRPDSTVSDLPLVLQPVTRQVIEATLPRTVQESSFQSGWSSGLGVMGDYGALGVVSLLLGFACALRLTWGPWTPLRAAARAGLACAVPLALVDNWLEQPAFTLPLMVLVAVGVSGSRAESEQAG